MRKVLTDEETKKINTIKDIVSSCFQGEAIDDYEALEAYDELQAILKDSH